MTQYKYFTKDSLIEAARAGNERGYNRQLDPEKVAEQVKWTKFLPVVWSMPHEHIDHQLVEPHVRVQVMVNAEDGDDKDEYALFDMSLERYNALPTYDPDKVAYQADVAGEGGQHRAWKKAKR